MILGIDLSLTGTGIALLAPDRTTLDAIAGQLPPQFKAVREVTDGLHYLGVLVATSPVDTFARWETIRSAVGLCARGSTMVLIEGYAYGANMAHSRAIAELGGIVRYHLHELGCTPIEVAPTALKKFLTGRGNADKNVVLKEVLKRYGVDLDDDNLADAFGLAKIGQSWDSHDGLPQFQIEVIEAIRKPTRVKRNRQRKAAS